MSHEAGLIATTAFALSFAVVGGYVAVRLGLPPLVGYLLAGVAVGPFTPGFVADPGLAHQLAEVGVILLMFGVGIHFSMRDLLAVRSVAIPGAVMQSGLTTALVAGFLTLAGWSLAASLTLGLAVSVASTVVLLRGLLERGLLDSTHGRIAVGWLIVEDLFIVVVLVVLPAVAPLVTGAGTLAGNPWLELGITLAKVIVLALLMFFVGVRIIPWLLSDVARRGSRELFTLSVLSLALGLAFAASELFGVSLALGAFLAGAAISESDLSHQAAAEALPLQDAFAVLFFVSVGMLFDPTHLLAAPLGLFGLLAIVVLGKGLLALGIVLALGHAVRSGLVVAVGLAQVGEFSFLLSDLGRQLGLMTEDGHNLVLAVAIVSITVNPFLFRALDPLDRWLAPRIGRRGSIRLDAPAAEIRRGHAVVCGHGRVGRVVVDALRRRGFTVVVVDLDRRKVEALRRDGVEAIYGDAANAALLEHLHLTHARVLILAIADASATRRIALVARRIKPDIDIVVRTHSEAEWRHLRDAHTEAVLGEREIAIELTAHALRRFGVSSQEIVTMARRLRDP